MSLISNASTGELAKQDAELYWYLNKKHLSKNVKNKVEFQLYEIFFLKRSITNERLLHWLLK